MSVGDLVLLSIASNYLQALTLRKSFMQRIIPQQTMFSKHKGFRNQTGPALIHHLCLHLWHKVQHFGAHDFDDISLPGLQVGSVAEQEEEEVLLWLFRESGWFAALSV